MTDYAGNTNKAKDKPIDIGVEPKVIEKVITGAVIEKKPGIGKKFKSVFFGGEFHGAVRYIAADVLLPAFRNLLVDATTKGVERVVYGESQVRPRRPGFNYSSRVQYNSPFSRQSAPDPRMGARLPDQPMSRTVRRDPNEIILASRDEAELVIERLIDIIDTYEVASVADLYGLLGLPTTAIDNKWGWNYLKTAEIRQTREGYLLDLPPLEEI